MWALPWLSLHIYSKDTYIWPNIVEFPSEIAKKITFEEQVTDMNIGRLQEVVDKWLYVTIPVMTLVI